MLISGVCSGFPIPAAPGRLTAGRVGRIHCGPPGLTERFPSVTVSWLRFGFEMLFVVRMKLFSMDGHSTTT